MWRIGAIDSTAEAPTETRAPAASSATVPRTGTSAADPGIGVAVV